MNWNPYKRLLRLIPDQPEQIGQVIATAPDGVIVQLPTGATLRARGTAEIGDHVYIQAGAIQGPAPAWSGVEHEI
jgi:hypothetical protein